MPRNPYKFTIDTNRLPAFGCVERSSDRMSCLHRRMFALVSAPARPDWSV
jgi:hypothetical protein